MIIYMGIKYNKTVLVKIVTTDIENKITIPKSIITKRGIFDAGTVEDERAYISSIQIESYSDSPKLDRLTDTILPTLSEDDSVYVIDLESKKLISYLGLNKRFKCFKKHTGVGTVFIDDFFEECLVASKSIYGVVDFDIERYNKAKLTLHPLLNTRQLFFYKDMPEGYYYSYQNKETTKKDINNPDSIDISKTKVVLGKKSSTNIYQIFHIEKQKEIDEMYSKWRANNSYDLYAILLLNRFTNPNNIYYKEQNRLINKKNPSRIETPKKDVLISEIRPAGLSYYAFVNFNNMKNILDEFNNNPDSIFSKCSIDITDKIYDDKYNILQASDFDIIYMYELNDKKYKIVTTTGLDLPTRNLLKNISKFKPTVHLLLINENNICLRYYTVVKYNSDSVLTANYPANLILLEDK